MRQFLMTLAAVGAFTLVGNTAFAHDPCDHGGHHHHSGAHYSARPTYAARPSYTVRYNAYPGYAGYNLIPIPEYVPSYSVPAYQPYVPTTVVEQPRTTFYYRGRGLSVGFGF